MLDVLVVGAGLSGIYALHALRSRGLKTRVLEAGAGVGGTWFWNRYPGARCDLESIEYSFSFSPEIEAEWSWSELMPPQAEIEAYLNFVTDRLGLRDAIRFETKVAAMHFDPAAAVWNVRTEDGDEYQAQFVIAATGMLSVPIDPAISGMESFAGVSVYASRYPRDGIDFTGKRVALIGTGSTGVQALPILARSARHVHVFQRSAAYTLPTTTRVFAPGEFEALRNNYPDIRASQRQARAAAARNGAFAALAFAAERPKLREASEAERKAALDEFGIAGALYWSDVMADPIANEMARELYGQAVSRIVRDPATAERLTPRYPFGCKRPIIDDGFYEAFNRENVTLVDLQEEGIQRIVPKGIVTTRGTIDFDVIFYATGFDALTGALDRIDIRGPSSRLLRDAWREDGPGSYLGLQIAGFPNLFIVGSLGGPGALANVIPCSELQIDTIVECIERARAHDCDTVEATALAQADWGELISEMVKDSIALSPGCNSWWIGSNVPGKPRTFLSYPGGYPEYRRKLEREAEEGFPGFEFA